MLTNGTCAKKLISKNSWKASHFCHVENLSRNLRKGNPNLKDVKLAKCKSSLMILKPK
jgi:hypothetical protein